jgi:hypothetical protein
MKAEERTRERMKEEGGIEEAPVFAGFVVSGFIPAVVG